jgi:hypothetical protein
VRKEEKGAACFRRDRRGDVGGGEGVISGEGAGRAAAAAEAEWWRGKGTLRIRGGGGSRSRRRRVVTGIVVGQQRGRRRLQGVAQYCWGNVYGIEEARSY